MTIKKFTALFASAALFGGSVSYADDAQFDASATILDALAVTLDTDLAFANVVPDASSAGTVEVSAAGARTCAPVLTCTGTVAAADFTVTGADGNSFAVTLPSSANISETGGETMLVDGFVSSLPGNTGTLTGGTTDFQLGATLNVGAAQAAGDYTGTFTVTVEYN